ncbi:hypothetical protein AAY473_016435 [Plecturocebus cupreus]
MPLQSRLATEQHTVSKKRKKEGKEKETLYFLIWGYVGVTWRSISAFGETYRPYPAQTQPGTGCELSALTRAGGSHTWCCRRSKGHVRVSSDRHIRIPGIRPARQLPCSPNGCDVYITGAYTSTTDRALLLHFCSEPEAWPRGRIALDAEKEPWLNWIHRDFSFLIFHTKSLCPSAVRAANRKDFTHRGCRLEVSQSEGRPMVCDEENTAPALAGACAEQTGGMLWPRDQKSWARAPFAGSWGHCRALALTELIVMDRHS